MLLLLFPPFLSLNVCIIIYAAWGYDLIEVTSSGMTHSLATSIFPAFAIDTFLPNTFSVKLCLRNKK